MARFEIRPLKTHSEFRQCEALQVAVWGNLGVGSEVLSVTQKYGGMVLGTLVGGKVAGFIYAFLARYHDRLVHWSHMMAVAKGFRDRGWGFRMKLVHRKLALAQGIPSICWTYDPLQSRNATLNLRRLGGNVDEYIRDCYGHFESRIEKGLPSDRFVIHWHLGTARVERRLAGESSPPPAALPVINLTRRNSSGFLENQRLRLNLSDPRLLVEIPANTDELRAKALPLALRWRLETRRIFSRFLPAGYRVDDFIPPGSSTEGRCFYLLRR